MSLIVNKPALLNDLLQMSREIHTFVSNLNSIDDGMYLLKVTSIDIAFSNLIANYVQDAKLAALFKEYFKLKLESIMLNRNNNNAIKLLEISSALLEIGTKMASF